ncbi:hypothetical protein GUJ93_ZPchr0008g14031 [Zizania palustris]|uniref:Uncharacterized protein n=1 Tax=Zizania palustris TaxID=103762 RepID=A0A8J5VFC6_ZIZPA|nr:hypothetical protein GUJ93_ZPchr0008g14031 [Zizania palustris]
MAAAFGAPFLWLVCLIYFVQIFFLDICVPNEGRDETVTHNIIFGLCCIFPLEHEAYIWINSGGARVKLKGCTALSVSRVPSFSSSFETIHESYQHIYRMVPFLTLCGQLCPTGINGTLFALFMSISNLGSTLCSFLGAAVAYSFRQLIGTTRQSGTLLQRKLQG